MRVATLLGNGRILALLENQGPGAGNEFQLTDSMARLMGVQPFHALEYEGMTYDCGKVGYMQATTAYALANAEHGDHVEKMLRDLLARRGK